MSDLSELLAPTNNPGLPRVEDFGRTLRRATLGLVFALGLPAVGLLCVVLILFRSVSELEQSERIIASARAIEELSVDAETALRGYQLTGDPVFLTGFNEARAAVPAHLDSLSGEVFGNAEKSGAVAALQRDLAALLTYSNEALARPRDGSETAAETAFNLRGRRLMENLRARLDKIVVREEVPRRQWLRLRDRLRVVLFVAAALLSLVGLPMTVIWVRRLLREMSISYGASVTAAEQRATELQVALRSIGDAVIATNLAGEVAFVNPVAEELTGWTNADARGRPLEEVFDIFNEQTGEPAENPAVRVLREGKVVGLANHTVLRARGGRETPIEDSAAPLLDHAGTIHGVVLVFRGVGEKRGFERRLFEAEWRSRTALEVGGAGSWAYEPAGDRMIGDAMLARTFGVPLERCTAGEPLSTFLARISADDRPRVRAALQEAAASGETFEIDWHLVHEDGSQRWVHARGRGEPAIAGEPHRILGFLHDITEEREIEDALRESEGRFRLLHELGDATRSLTDPHQIMESVARLLGAHLQASRCAYADVEKDSDHFAIQHDYTDGCASIVGTYQLALFGPRAVSDMLAGRTLVCSDVDGELAPEEGADMFNALGIKAVICCPLLKNGGLRAMMAIHQATVRAWKPAEVTLVQDVVERCWAVIERARAEAEVRERARLSALRGDIALQLAADEDLDRTLQTCCALLVHHLDAAFARVWTMNAAEPVLGLRASAGLYTHLDGPHSKVRVGEFKIGAIAESRQPHLTNDVVHDPRVSDPEWAAREKIVAFAGYPLTVEGRVLGVVAMFARHPFSDAVLGDLAPIADSLAQCIERKRAASALHRSETLKAAIINTSLDGFILMNHEGMIADWNSAAETIFGITREEAIGRALGDAIVPTRLREAHRQGVARYVQSREARILGRRYELPAIRADGAEFPCEISITHISGTEPPLFAGFVRDISDRQRAAAALVASEARLRHLADAMPQIVWMAKADGTVDYYNRRWYEFTARAEGEVGDASWMPILHPEDQQPCVDRWYASVRSGEDYEIRYRFYAAATGEYRWFLGRARPERDDEGQILRWFGTSTDIDDVVRAEEATSRSWAEAEAARQQAEAASRAKDDFLAALSHELRTPLTPVLMTAAALCEDERLPADAREQLRMVERNIALEARLIDDLLDLTRIANGKLPLRPQACDAHSLIGLAVEIIRADAQLKTITLELDLAAQRCGVTADPARFQQVVWNLLRNAVKFTPPGGRIAICTRNTGEDDAHRLHIEVSDSGIGIAPEALSQIFLPFEQAGLANDHRFGGMGMGLAIARAIVDLHGGTIRAESAGAGCGATFTVEFPGAGEPPAGMSAPSFLQPLRTGNTPPFPAAPERSARLLLVEDHEPTLQVMARLLSRAGHRVVTASTVADALAAASVNKFDMVISDLGLPDGTGTALMKSLRDLHGLSGIALSGYGMEADIARSREAGFKLHLTKPVDFPQLERALREALADEPPARGSAES